LSSKESNRSNITEF
jgi:hypothetical protein